MGIEHVLIISLLYFILYAYINRWGALTRFKEISHGTYKNVYNRMPSPPPIPTAGVVLEITAAEEKENRLRSANFLAFTWIFLNTSIIIVFPFLNLSCNVYIATAIISTISGVIIRNNAKAASE